MITCPTCGKQNQDHYKFCLGCGSELPRDQVKAPVHASTPTPPSGMPAVAPPPGGGAPVPAAPAQPMPAQPMPAQPMPAQPMPAQPMPAQPPAAAASAPAPTPAPAQAAPEPAAAPGPLKCPSCGTEVPPGFKFCGRCGHPMDQVAAPAAAPAPAQAPAAGPAATALGRIIMIQPDGTEGMSIPIGDDGATVGRSDKPPLSEDFFLSPNHARFKFTAPGQLQVEDLGGLNGVFIRLIPEQVYEINPGNIIRMGQEVVLFELLPEPKATADGTELMGSPRKTAWGRLSLVVSKGKMGNAFLLEGNEVMIGRERGHIIFPEDGYVSGLHLKITKDGNQYTVVDVGSSNGSYLRVDGTGQINSGDYVLMGQYLYKIEF